MTLRHLQIFKTVCELGSITIAANELHMTQPAVSIAIKELETFYGTKLFDRMNRKIYLTETGTTLKQYSDSILTQFDESQDIIRNDKLPPKCRLGSNITFAELYLPQWISKIKNAISEIEISVYVNDSNDIENKIISNKLDLAIVDNISECPEIKSNFLYRETMCVVCSPHLSATKMNLSTLCNMPLLLRENGSGNRNSVNATLSKKGLKAVPIMESTSTLSLLNMAKSGFGYTILPRNIIENELNLTLREVEITDGNFERYYYLIHHKDKYFSNAVLKILDIPVI